MRRHRIGSWSQSTLPTGFLLYYRFESPRVLTPDIVPLQQVPHVAQTPRLPMRSFSLSISHPHAIMEAPISADLLLPLISRHCVDGIYGEITYPPSKRIVITQITLPCQIVAPVAPAKCRKAGNHQSGGDGCHSASNQGASKRILCLRRR